MKTKYITLASLLVGAGFISACQQEVEAPPPVSDKPRAQVIDLAPAAQPAAANPAMVNGLATGVVAEVIDAGGYTYVQVDVGGQALWAAGPPTPIAVGDTITFSTMIPMKDFHSKAMDRDFPVLYFVDGFSTLNSTAGSAGTTAPHPVTSGAAPAAAPAPVANIEKAEGGYTIAEALAQSKELAGKPIRVRGQVTKYTTGIMGKNWIHMVDGSSSEDLIVTTKGTTSMGAVIVVEGALSLDRDFGMGYFYKVLMEDATVTTE